ncbi:hypothetical protein AYL99_11798 [Fonsecaea erecta]|uniref:Uncharacterized protein n=1 Tax=Fonsecaea erecta TaxID=1367422 RepID=A0A178Z2K0_9EURO|nr:hypothetical protein AYL99_11798 [Fonsecaea erecta]OAP54038.1 hypothetical protein AYL99_11798 [Fonsecaea erecta]
METPDLTSAQQFRVLNSSSAHQLVSSAVPVAVSVLTAIVSATVTAPVALIGATAPAASGVGGEDPKDNQQPHHQLPDDVRGPSLSMRVKTPEPNALCCCGCLRRLRTAGKAAGSSITCEFTTEGGQRSENCSYCSGANHDGGDHGGDQGCVPMPTELVARANRLWEANLACAAGEVGTPSVADIQLEADALEDEMRLAGVDIARESASGLACGSCACSASGARAGADDETTVLAHILDAMRAGVDSYREVHGLEPLRWPGEDED